MPSYRTQLFTLCYNPLGFRGKYHVMISYFDEEHNKDSVSYNMDLYCSQTRDQHFLFTLEKSGIIVNDEEARESKMLSLAHECGKVLYPLELLVDANGLVSGINNYKSIGQRWSDLMPRLLYAYEGEIVQQYISDTGFALANKTLFSQIISQDLFCNAFFAPLYRKYDYTLSGKMNFLFPVFPDYYPLNFKTEQFINPDQNPDKSFIEIKLVGKTMENVSTTAFLNERDILENISASLSAIYVIEKQSGNISSMKMDVEYLLYGLKSNIRIFIDSPI